MDGEGTGGALTEAIATGFEIVGWSGLEGVVIVTEGIDVEGGDNGRAAEEIDKDAGEMATVGAAKTETGETETTGGLEEAITGVEPDEFLTSVKAGIGGSS